MGFKSYLEHRAKSVGGELAFDAKAFAKGANTVIGAPTASTLKGAAQGNKGDILKTGIAVASVIPVAEGVRALRGASEAGRTAEVFADARRAYSLRGTAQESMPWIHEAGKMQRLINLGEKSTLSERIMASGERGALDTGKLSQFPDTAANAVRRAKTRVMGAIGGGSTADLAAKIAATKEEIVKLGGTPPTGPFEAASAAKLSAVKQELSDMPVRAAKAADVKAGFEGGRISDKAKRVALKVVKGGESGMWKLPGTRALGNKEVKVSAYLSTHEAASDTVFSAAEVAQDPMGHLQGRSKFHKELMKFQRMVPHPPMHSTRISKN